MSTKIIHYSPRFYPLLGGVETHVDTLIKNMPEYRFEVLAKSLPKQSLSENYLKNTIVRRFTPVDYWTRPPSKRIPWKFILLYGSFADYIRTKRVSRYIKKSNFDLLHIHEIDVWNLLRLDRLLRINIFTKLAEKMSDYSFACQPVLLTKHFMFTLDQAPKAFLKFEKKFTKKFDNIICVDKHIFTNVSEWASDNENVWFIPNSVDTEKFGFMPFPDRDGLNVGFVGRLDPVRGIGLLYQLIRNLPSYVKLHLVLSGSPDEFYNFKIKIKSVKADNIRIYPNAPPNQVSEILKDIDVLLNPAIFPAIGRSTLEAMSCGRPVIVLDDMGDRYPIIDRKTGYLVCGDINELLRLIEHIHGNKNELRKLGKNSRKIIEKEFSNGVIIPKIKKIYEDLLI